MEANAQMDRIVLQLAFWTMDFFILQIRCEIPHNFFFSSDLLAKNALQV